MDTLNLVQVLHQKMGLSLAEIAQGLEQRCPGCQIDIRELEEWIAQSIKVPDWANRPAALWVIEFWMAERDACEAEGLLKIDEKYTRLLKGFSMGDIIAMRNSLIESEPN